MQNQGVTEDIPTKILTTLEEYKRCGVTSLTSDTLSKTPRVPSNKVTEELTGLIKAGKVSYARNTQRATQRFYQLVGGRTK